MLAEAIERLQAAGTENPRLEAQLLMALALVVPRTSILAGMHPPPTPEQEQEFARLIAEREKRVPLAYLRGTQEFYALEFIVTPAVLVPRPETEMLVEEALRLARSQGDETPFLLADVGTGSGCIPISVAKHQQNVIAAAFDVSAEALEVARRNAQRHGVSHRIQFSQGDLLSGVAPEIFHCIVSNPPYIASQEIESLQPEVRDYEPRLALDGGSDGLEAYRRLIPQAAFALQSGGWLCLEIGHGQADAVKNLMCEAGLHEINARPDFAGIERVVAGRK